MERTGGQGRWEGWEESGWFLAAMPEAVTWIRYLCPPCAVVTDNVRRKPVTAPCVLHMDGVRSARPIGIEKDGRLTLSKACYARCGKRARSMAVLRNAQREFEGMFGLS